MKYIKLYLGENVKEKWGIAGIKDDKNVYDLMYTFERYSDMVEFYDTLT